MSAVPDGQANSLTAGAADFHGLGVAWTTRGLPRDPARLLFQAFLAEGGSGPRQIVLAIEAGSVDENAVGFRPCFFQGNVRGFEREGDILILAPAARVMVARGGERIDAVVDPGALNEAGFVNTTLVIALAVALRWHGLFHLHGGALVRREGQRVLVLGDSGSGKSTVTLALLGEGAEYLGDDTLFLAARDGHAQLLAYPRPFHLGPATARAFPAIRSERVRDDVKLHVAVDGLPGKPVRRMDAPHLVLFPRVTRETTTNATELAPGDAFGLALRSCAFVAVDGLVRKVEQLELLREILATGRAYDLALGADWLEEPARAAEKIPWPSPPIQYV